MTRERLEYLVRVSVREGRIRLLLAEQKHYISKYKYILNNNEMSRYERQRCLSKISEHKFFAFILRDELQRLKGMDRVVVPRDVHITYLGFDKVGKCTCGGWVTPHEIYCHTCGRRVLWEKVKECV